MQQNEIPSHETKKIAAILVGGGKGSRFGRDLPKQYHLLKGQPIFLRALKPFLDCKAIDSLVSVIHPDDLSHYLSLAPSHPKLRPPVYGGLTRQLSVYYGLLALEAEAPDYVLVHDAARPFLPAAVLEGVLKALTPEKGGVPAIPVVDTLRKQVSPGFYQEVDRTDVWRVQTPQGFCYPSLLKAHTVAQENHFHGGLDDASIFQEAGFSYTFTSGSPFNLKLTSPEDWPFFERFCDDSSL